MHGRRTTQLPKWSINHSIGRIYSWRFSFLLFLLTKYLVVYTHASREFDRCNSPHVGQTTNCNVDHLDPRLPF